MANLLCEFRVVFPIDGFTGFDRSAVCSGLVCGQCSHLVARRHACPGSDGLVPVPQGSPECIVKDVLFEIGGGYSLFRILLLL